MRKNVQNLEGTFATVSHELTWHDGSADVVCDDVKQDSLFYTINGWGGTSTWTAVSVPRSEVATRLNVRLDEVPSPKGVFVAKDAALGSQVGERGKEYYWRETLARHGQLAGNDRVRLHSLTEICAKAGVLCRDIYFEGGDVLHCYEGRFRFSLEGKRVVEIEAGDAIVVYPDQRVTIEALGAKNKLSYVVFFGNGVSDYFDSFKFFDGLKGQTSGQHHQFERLRQMVSSGSDRSTYEMTACLESVFRTFAHDFREKGKALLIDAIFQIRQNLRNRIVRLDPLYGQLGVSHTYLYRVFTEAGIGTPSDFIRREQLRLVVHRLRFTNLPIGEIAESAGFISKTHFANFLKRMVNRTASEIRRGDAVAVK